MFQITLFIRSGKKISLTDEGILLKRRALEILNLEKKTLEELKGKEDLIGKPLILPERVNVQSELANWFGKDFSKLQIAFTSNLGTNAGVIAANGLEYVTFEPGCRNNWHGAAPDEWFSHLAIEVPGENGSNEWLEPVIDEEYEKL